MPPLLPPLLAIGAGAAIGAWARWGLGLWLNALHPALPMGTLAANLVGGYAIGLALGWFALNPSLPPEWRLFAITGLLGGLTTFSTFSAEMVDLLLRGQSSWVLAGIALHVGGSLAMTGAGLATVRGLRAVLA